MEFQLRINLGNEAMQTGNDVAHALLKVAGRLEDVGDMEETDVVGGLIRDENGNAVGRWEI